MILLNVLITIFFKTSGLARPEVLLLDKTSTSIANLLPNEDLPIQNVYQHNSSNPIWIKNDGFLLAAHDLLRAIENAETNGLETKDYFYDELKNRLRPFEVFRPNIYNDDDILTLAQTDILLTKVFYRLVTDIYSGREAYLKDSEWFIPRQQFTGNLLDILKEQNIQDYISSLYPKHLAYLKLKKEFVHYLDIQEGGRWDQPTLKQKLKMLGDKNLKQFQLRHGLQDTNELDLNTIIALNIPIETRLHELKLNLERWRWLPKEFNSDFIVINIPNYKLIAFKDNKVELKMNVVVGQEFRQTPSFVSQIEKIDINPEWKVPFSVAVNDLLPILKKSPKSLLERNFIFYSTHSNQVIDPSTILWNDINEKNFFFRVVQQPGPTNALGKIRFWLPNDFQIFLHDTPNKSVFQEKIRAFSSGCIRLEKPLSLARFLLAKEPESVKIQYQGALKTTLMSTILLTEPTPVYFLYMTTWVDDKNLLHFRSDIYQRNL